MKKIILSLILILIGTFMFSIQLNFTNYLPEVKKTNGSIMIILKNLNNTNEIFLYYKTDILKEFQVRKMKLDKNGNAYYHLNTDNLYGKEVEYFIVENKNNKNSISPVFTIKEFTKEEVPDVYFFESYGESGISIGGSSNPFININGSIDSTIRLYDDSQYPGEKVSSNGNLRLSRNIYDNDYQFSFDTTFTYMTEVTDTESNFNLSSMKVLFKKGNNKFEVGDISLNHSELTLNYLNRRGMSYELNGKTIYFSSFYSNSQQKTGFDGFGIPPSDANYFGAIFGFNIKSIFKIRGMYMTGMDNLDSKTIVSNEEKYRKGDVFSAFGSLNLFNNKLKFDGEYAKSNFGKSDDENNIEKNSGEAWKASMNFNYKIFNGYINYKDIDENYYSIANLFLVNDKKGLNSGITMTIKSFSLTISYTDELSYINNPAQPTRINKNLNSTLSWLIGNHFRIGLNYSANNLDYDQKTGLQTGSSKMETISYSGSIGYTAGYNSLNLSLGKTESKTFTSNINAAVSLSLSLGSFLTLSPSVNYQKNENLTDDSTSEVISYYINSQITFIPNLFTLTITGSQSKTENSNYSSGSTNTSLNASLTFYMSKLFKNKIQPSLSFKARYMKSDYMGTITESKAGFLNLMISF